MNINGYNFYQAAGGFWLPWSAERMVDEMQPVTRIPGNFEFVGPDQINVYGHLATLGPPIVFETYPPHPDTITFLQIMCDSPECLEVDEETAEPEPGSLMDEYMKRKRLTVEILDDEG